MVHNGSPHYRGEFLDRNNKTLIGFVEILVRFKLVSLWNF